MLYVGFLPTSSSGVSVLKRGEHYQFTMKWEGMMDVFSYPTATGGAFLFN